MTDDRFPPLGCLVGLLLGVAGGFVAALACAWLSGLFGPLPPRTMDCSGARAVVFVFLVAVSIPAGACLGMILGWFGWRSGALASVVGLTAGTLIGIAFGIMPYLSGLLGMLAGAVAGVLRSQCALPPPGVSHDYLPGIDPFAPGGFKGNNQGGGECGITEHPTNYSC